MRCVAEGRATLASPCAASPLLCDGISLSDNGGMVVAHAFWCKSSRRSFACKRTGYACASLASQNIVLVPMYASLFCRKEAVRVMNRAVSYETVGSLGGVAVWSGAVHRRGGTVVSFALVDYAAVLDSAYCGGRLAASPPGASLTQLAAIHRTLFVVVW